MAYQLLANDEKGYPPKHLYRHDIESIFYVILLLCCRYKLVDTPNSLDSEILQRMKVPSRFDSWYKLDRAQLKAEKGDFLMGDVTSSPTVNSGWTAFQPWVTGLHQQFMDGLNARKAHNLRRTRGKATESFDDETLQGCVSYSAVVDTCCQFAGSTLVVHNDQLEESA
ncbi:hypothetical protein DFS33DRAFT_1490386 [Desarmillaria ectypa]|nr:hypothetical protein DFS33DRAFT_1490386 [Desarmillaria ectypa]